ncbi:MAG: isoprenylcysteine carboxylmethyltransferase family protein [Burkholderiales bacterium]
MRLENRVPPPAIALITAAAMWAESFLPPALADGGLAQRLIAAVLSAAGLAVAALGVLKFRAHGTTIDPTHPERAATLVVSGVYRYTRNPMYVGFTLMLVAWAIQLGSAWALGGPLVFVWYMVRFQIGPEERALRTKFGSEFETYASRVGRWL